MPILIGEKCRRRLRRNPAARLFGHQRAGLTQHAAALAACRARVLASDSAARPGVNTSEGRDTLDETQERVGGLSSRWSPGRDSTGPDTEQLTT